MQALNQRIQLGQILSEELFEFCTVPSIWQDMIFDLQHIYLAHVIEQPNFRTPNPQYLQRNFVYLFFAWSKGGLTVSSAIYNPL